jgi:photosystem II stability/assembly factor-like uncharacterized protein
MEGKMAVKRSLIAGGLVLLGLVLTLVVVQATTLAPAPLAAPAGFDEWTPLGGPMVTGGQGNAVAVDPTVSETVYAAIALIDHTGWGPSTIYKSTDGAVDWTPVYTLGRQVHALGVSGTHVYAGAVNWGGDDPAAIFASHDGGLTWAPVYSRTDPAVSWLDLSMDPTDPLAVIVGGWIWSDADQIDKGLVVATADGGLSWSRVLTVTTAQNTVVTAVLIDPHNPDLWLAAVRLGEGDDSAIYRSDDGGATWPVSYTIAGAHVMSLAAHPSDPDLLFAGTGGDNISTWGPNLVYRSPDAGLTWTQVSSDTGGPLAVEPPSTVYAFANGFWASTADGDPGSWVQLTGFVEWVGSLAIDLGTSPPALYAAAMANSVFKSSDGGYQWDGVQEGIETPATPRDVALDRANPGKLFVSAAWCKGEWLTTDGGASWTTPAGTYCTWSFAVHPSDPSIVYAGTESGTEGTVRRSSDGGLTFTPVYTAPFIVPGGDGGGESIRDLAIAPSNPDTVYAAGQDNPNWEGDGAVILRTQDGGLSWTPVFTLPSWSTVEVVAIDPNDEAVVYAGGEDCSTGACIGFAYRSADAGLSWTEVFSAETPVTSIVVSHGDSNDVYLANRRYDVYKSEDAGASWTLILSNAAPFFAPSGYLLALDPYLPDHVYLGGMGYFAETLDGGATWIDGPLTNGVPQLEPRALAVDFGTDLQKLYAGLSGVWAHSRLGPLPYQVYLPVGQKGAVP